MILCPRCGAGGCHPTYRCPIDPANDRFACADCGEQFTRYAPARPRPQTDRQPIENAAACLREAQTEIGREFELDPETNLYGRSVPEWAAAVRDLIHAAQGHLTNALDPLN